LTVAKVCRALCIMDTDSLLFSFKLECPPKGVIDRFDKQFDLFFPRKVVQEYRGGIRSGKLKNYDDVKSDIDLFIDQKDRAGRIVDDAIYSDCLKYVKRWFDLTGKQEIFYTLGDGEKHCVALGLHMSRKNKKCLVVMTDDFRARNAGVDVFVDKQQIGLISSLLTGMLFVFFVSTDLSGSYMRGLVNDYFDLNKPKTQNMRNLKDEILDDIKFSCKEQHFRDCGLSCLMH
jgi:hypothetical protein